MPPLPPITNAKCPRCGYDLRGAIETWKEQCPLLGICTECGLEIKWAEVLHPEKFEPQWCVEFVPSRKLFLQSCGKTLLRSFWPFHFWHALKMSMPIRWRQLVTYIVVLFMPLLIGYVTLQTTAAFRMRYDLEQSMAQQQQSLSQSLAQMQMMMSSQRLTTQQRQQIILQTQNLQQIVNTGYSINHSYLSAVIEMVVSPLGQTSSGTTTSGLIGVWPYTSPIECHPWLFELRLGYLTSVSSKHKLYLIVVWFGLSMWLWFLFPFSFVLLPVSRRRAKVRWSHVLRVTIYGCFIPISAITVSMFAIAIGYAFENTFGSMIQIVQLSSRYFMTTLIIIWWATAIKRYLHILHSWAVACLLSIMLFFMYLGVLWAVFPDFLLALW